MIKYLFLALLFPTLAVPASADTYFAIITEVTSDETEVMELPTIEGPVPVGIWKFSTVPKVDNIEIEIKHGVSL